MPRLAGGEPVTAIAFDLGYDSAAAFTTMFKRMWGVPPSRYRPAGMGEAMLGSALNLAVAMRIIGVDGARQHE